MTRPTRRSIERRIERLESVHDHSATNGEELDLGDLWRAALKDGELDRKENNVVLSPEERQTCMAGVDRHRENEDADNAK